MSMLCDSLLFVQICCMPGRDQAEVCDSPAHRHPPRTVLPVRPSAGHSTPRTPHPAHLPAAACGLLGSSGLALWLPAQTVDAALQVLCMTLATNSRRH